MTFPATPRRERNAEWLVRQWEEGRLEAEQSPRGSVLVLDEIQKIEGWSETVKGLWDADRARDCPLRVVIPGSAPLLMQSGLSENLAGRFETIRVTHWSFAFDFDLPQYLYFGGYPGAAPLVRDPDRWRGYILGALVEPNIERDLLVMTRGGQASPAQAALRTGHRLLRADPVLHQDAGATSRRREHDHLGALSRTPCQRRPARRPSEVHRQPCLGARFQSQAQRAEHRPVDGRFRLLLR